MGVAVVWLVVLVVAMAVLTGPVRDAQEDDHFTSFAPTTVMVVASGKAKYRCADVYNCQCAEAPGAPTCGDINHEGVCSYVVAEPERSRCQCASAHGACLDCFRAGSYCCRCELIQLVVVVVFRVSLHVCVCVCVCVTGVRGHSAHNCLSLPVVTSV